VRPSRGKGRPRREGEPDGGCPAPVGASCSRRGGAGEPGASSPPGPAPSSSRGRRQPGRLPELRRERAGPSLASRTPACAGRIGCQPRGGQRCPGGAAGAMRTEFGAGEAEHSRPLHLLPGVLRALPAFVAPSRRPRGE